jgi:hypothetical protein
VEFKRGCESNPLHFLLYFCSILALFLHSFCLEVEPVGLAPKWVQNFNLTAPPVFRLRGFKSHTPRFTPFGKSAFYFGCFWLSLRIYAQKLMYSPTSSRLNYTRLKLPELASNANRELVIALFAIFKLLLPFS